MVVKLAIFGLEKRFLKESLGNSFIYQISQGQLASDGVQKNSSGKI